jgi:cyclic pyranopterin phosphate synthase
MLIDTFNRKHTYLRISLTDVCNFRCQYCMPEDVHFMPSSKLMSADEIDLLATRFVQLGITKIRLTGGEPLVRKDANQIITKLSKLPVELTMTTNGVLLDDYFSVFKEVGIRSINVSLDTLKPDRFFEITRRDAFERVWTNITSLVEMGIHVKLNVVVMKGINDIEILDFVQLTERYPLHVRFIEFMPFDGNRWNNERVLPYQELIVRVENKFSILKLKDEVHDTTKKYKVFGSQGTFAVITTMSQPFCSGCNRLRLTADGKMKNCLFSQHETDLLSALRKGEDVVELIRQDVLAKKKETGGQLLQAYEEIDASKLINRSMVNIGG